MKHLRDKIAHAAVKTDIETQLLKKNEGLEDLLEITFKDVETFLNANIKIIDKISYYLKLEINSLATQGMARQRAEELLMNCKFDIPKSL